MSLALGACGSDGGTKSSTGTPPSATAAVPSNLVGTFVRTISLADIKAAGASLAGPPEGLPTGPATLRISPDGTAMITASDGGNPSINISMTAAGDLRVQDQPNGGGFCRNPNFIGTYAVEASTDHLTFTKVQDDAGSDAGPYPRGCRDRVAALVGTWTRK